MSTAHLRSFVKPVPRTVAAADVKKTASRLARTVHILQVEEWRRDNPSILTGWRTNVSSWKECVHSLWYLHNETVNVWTHLLPSIAAFVAILTGWYLLSTNEPSTLAFHPLEFLNSTFGSPIPLPSASLPSVSLADTTFFTLLYLGSAICFSLSAFYHLGLCHCADVVNVMRKADFLGIFVLGNANFLSTFYYGFYCEPKLRNAYILMMTISCEVGGCLIISPAFQRVAYRHMRIAMFIGVGSTAAIPFLHAILKHGWAEANHTMAFGWIGLEVLCYVGGAFIYAERFPERFAPGRFDLVGSSHQIFHVLAVVGVLFQAAAARQGFQVWHVERAGVCPVI